MSKNLSYSTQSLLHKFNEFQLPVSCDLENVKSVINQPGASTSDIISLTRHDPVFCLYAQKLAGERQKKRAGEVSGLTHALSLLGVDGVRQLVARLAIPEKHKYPELKQVLAESVLASSIAAKLAELKGSPIHENETSALFARTTEWLMYWLHPRKSWQLRRMFYRRPFSADHVSEILFNFKYSHLQQQVAESFHLPYLNQRLENFYFLKDTRELLTAVRLHRQKQLLLEDCSRSFRLKIGAPEMLPVVANRLAQAVCSPWLRNAWGRWLDIACIHTHKSKKKIQKCVLSACREVIEQGVDFKQFFPASALLNNASETPYQGYMVNRKKVRTKVLSALNALELEKDSATKQSKAIKSKPLKKSLSDTLTDSSRESSAENLTDTLSESVDSKTPTMEAIYLQSQINKIRAYCRQLTDKPERFNNTKQVLQKSLTELVESTPIERAAFLVIQSNGKILNYLSRRAKKLSAGSQVDEPELELTTTIKQTPIWYKFTQKASFLCFEKVKHAKYWSQLPDAIDSDERVNLFLFNSLAYGGQVRAFLYADMALSQQLPSEELMKDFRRLARALSVALRYHRTQKAHS